MENALFSVSEKGHFFRGTSLEKGRFSWFDMQQNVPAASVPAQHYDQQPQPALPSYAEAMRTAAPPTFNYPRTVDQETYHPSAPLYNTPAQSVPIHPQYPSQPNYTQTGYPATICTYPPSYATNAYSPYGQTSDDCPGGPTTIHIIRPMPVESSACCSGKFNIQENHEYNLPKKLIYEN